MYSTKIGEEIEYMLFPAFSVWKLQTNLEAGKNLGACTPCPVLQNAADFLSEQIRDRPWLSNLVIFYLYRLCPLWMSRKFSDIASRHCFLAIVVIDFRSAVIVN